MDIFQKDITGQSIQITSVPKETVKEKSHQPVKQYMGITIMDGVDEKYAENNAMLIHRILQKKVIYGKFSNEIKNRIIMKILKNEMSIKTGELDAVSASRDSLLDFFVQKKNSLTNR